LAAVGSQLAGDLLGMLSLVGILIMMDMIMAVLMVPMIMFSERDIVRVGMVIVR
jgi:hypothetical protein